jgi:hypothetical protein
MIVSKRHTRLLLAAAERIVLDPSAIAFDPVFLHKRTIESHPELRFIRDIHQAVRDHPRFLRQLVEHGIEARGVCYLKMEYWISFAVMNSRSAGVPSSVTLIARLMAGTTSLG